MTLLRAEARYLLALINKGRSLVMLDERRAYSPFAYDKKFFRKLRPDQVPRFLRCITDPQKLPKRYVELDELTALQDRVDLEKVEAIRSAPDLKPPVVVRIRDGGKLYIADGLHRSTADWLDHKKDMEVHYCDLSAKTENVEPVPGAGRFAVSEEHAEHQI